MAETPDGRVVALRPLTSFPFDTAFTVTVRAGVRSLEGPRTTTTAVRWKFATPGPFRVVGLAGSRRERPAPGEPWRIGFSNPVDRASLDAATITVEPPVELQSAVAIGPYVELRAASQPDRTYRVTLDPALSDVFGQPLGSSEPVPVRVGKRRPRLAILGGDHVILDPASDPVLQVRTVGLDRIKVLVYAVGPQHWADWQAAQGWRWSDKDIQFPGERVGELVLTVTGSGREWADAQVDLSSWLDDRCGQFIVRVEPKDRMSEAERRRLTDASWVQVTRLGVDAVVDATTLRAWVTDLSTGAPIGGATATLGPASAVSGADGTCALSLTDDPEPVLAVSLGRDVALLPAGPVRGWHRRDLSPSAAWMVFDDRGLYRPGESVRLKGWLRTRTAGPAGDIAPAPAALESVSWTAWDAVGNEIASGAVPVDGLGGFDITVELPEEVALGQARVDLRLPHQLDLRDEMCSHRFRIAEFRRPEYEIAVHIAPDRAIVGDVVTASAQADYYAGGALRGAPVRWWVTATPARYSPPGWDRFTFGAEKPWWQEDFWSDDVDEVGASFEGVTGDDGRHHLAIGTDLGSDPRTWSVCAEATVEDVNRQAWTASSSVLVHPAALCVGVRSQRSFVTGGRPLEIETVVVDLDGAPMPDIPVDVRAERWEHRQVAGRWQWVVAETVERGVTSGTGAVGVTLERLTPGRWTVSVEAADGEGRAHRSTIEVWIAGAGAGLRAEDDELQLIPSQQSYAPGDVAEVLLVAPFSPAYGVLLVERDGVVHTEPLRVTDTLHTLRVRVEDAHVPGVHVHVLLAGAGFAEASVHLAVPPVTRTLAVAVTPQAPRLAPGEQTVLDLVVTAADGSPVTGAGAAVIVVDEAALAVAGYRNPDPLRVFYPQRDAGVQTARSRPRMLVAQPDMPPDPDEMAIAAMCLEASPPAGSLRTRAMPSEVGAPPIRTRSDFSALAVFAASVITGADGHAAVPVRLPDNLTRYRVLAVATDGAARFGVGESSLTARLPLMVRPSPPRFLSWGDTFELPVVVQNQTEAAREVEVAVRADNAVLTQGAGRRLVVPANDRAEVRFPAATDSVGRACFEVVAAAGPDTDAARVTLPVWSPATTEAYALHGVLDDAALQQPVRAPADAVRSFGGLEITLSSTGVAALSDAVMYLADYPFECAEQVASRVLAIAALRDVLSAFGTEENVSPAELESAVVRDIETLAARQCADGGFGWWRRTEESWPYISVHVGNALARARAKGFTAPEEVVTALLDYLRTIQRRFPHDYPADSRAAIEAYAISVRAALGDPDPAAAQELLARSGGGLSVEGLAWLLPVLAADASARDETREVRRKLANSVVETAGPASVTVRYEDGAHLLLASDRRADAVVLEALIADQPESDLIPKLVAGLLAHRRAGRWGSTQENAFVLLALGRYYDTYEAATPDFVARVWLGEAFAGEQRFHGRTTDRRHLVVPMATLAARSDDEHDLLLAKDGPGRLYYRLGMRYAPADLALGSLDRGFEVSRAYEAIDDPSDVRRDDDGTWRIRAGARVRVSLTMTTPTRRYHVALVDPLPAGLEPVDPALATTAADTGSDGSEVGVVGAPGLVGPGRSAGHWSWWSRPWFDHENLRDNRAEAFTSLLWEGTYRYRYTARATTPGTFTAGPPKAEEMYSPEVFGRGATDRVVVE